MSLLMLIFFDISFDRDFLSIINAYLIVINLVMFFLDEDFMFWFGVYGWGELFRMLFFI
jgi:hypothetical protein